MRLQLSCKWVYAVLPVLAVRMRDVRSKTRSSQSRHESATYSPKHVLVHVRWYLSDFKHFLSTSELSQTT